MTEQYTSPEDLAEALDKVLNGRDAPKSSDDPLVDTALKLVHAPRPRMSEEAQARVQARMLQVHSQPVNASPRILRLPLTHFAAAASIVLIMLFMVIAPSVASSLPGDTLYPLKRAGERVELTLASSDKSRSEVYLKLARRRASEAQTLLANGEFSEDAVNAALDNLINAAQLAANTSSDVVGRVERDTSEITMQLNQVLEATAQQELASAATIVSLSERLETAREDGLLMLPPEPEPAGTEEPPQTAITPEMTPEPEETETPEPGVIEPPQTEMTPETTPEPEETETSETVVVDVPQPETTPEAESTEEITDALEESEASEQPAVERAPTITIAYVDASDRVNVRGGPGTDYDVLLLLEPGTALQIIGWNEDGVWTKIRLYDNREGWIFSPLISVTPPTTTTTGGDSPTTSEGDTGTGGDFGCEHPGDFCNAPGQQDNPSEDNRPQDDPAASRGRSGQ